MARHLHTSACAHQMTAGALHHLCWTCLAWAYGQACPPMGLGGPSLSPLRPCPQLTESLESLRFGPGVALVSGMIAVVSRTRSGPAQRPPKISHMVRTMDMTALGLERPPGRFEAWPPNGSGARTHHALARSQLWGLGTIRIDTQAGYTRLK
jgi:hypothetical protein